MATPWIRRRRMARVVVDEADDALAGRLPQLAEQAPPAAARADDEDAPLGAAADERRETACEPRSQKRERPMRNVQRSTSMRYTPRGKPLNGTVAHDEEECRRLGEDDAARMLAASRAPA